MSNRTEQVSKIPSKKSVFDDPSFIFLLGANLLTIAFALFEQWNIYQVMFVYWAQSIIIGIFNFVRIATLKNFSTEGLTINGRPVQSTNGTRADVASFFAMHYGFFHVGYAVFLFQYLGGISSYGILMIILATLSFGVHHFFSYLVHREQDRETRYNIGVLMLFPYARIIPMHFTLVFATLYSTKELVVFLVLKTFADLIMHGIHHSMRQAK